MFKFIKNFHRHKYIPKKWRLIHYDGGNPSEICVGVECEVCKKRKLIHRVPRNKEWEEKYGDLKDSSSPLWDFHWEESK